MTGYRNIADCIAVARDNKEIEPIRAADAIALAQQLEDQYASVMPREAAAVQASQDVKDAVRKNRQANVHKVLNELRTRRKLYEDIMQSDEPHLVLTSLIEHSDNRSYRGESVRSIREALEQFANAEVQEYLRAAGAGLTGTSRNKALTMDVVRALYGEEVASQSARDMAAAIEKAQDTLRRQFNAHGGDIGKLENRGVSQSHDAHRILRAGQDTWKAEITQGLDWHRIIDNRTGKPFAAEPGAIPAAAEVNDFLDQVYENIVSGGWMTRDASAQPAGRALFNRRADHRVLHFKSADDWLAYNRKYGGRDAFTAVMMDLHGMARDVALMRVLGPNPNAGLEFAIQVAEKRAAMALARAKTPQAKKAAERLANNVRAEKKRSRNMLDIEAGAASIPVNTTAANVAGSLRNVATGAYLGSALLSSLSDIATYSRAAKVMGLKPSNMISDHVKLLASPGERELAAQMGFVSESLANGGAAMARWADGAYGLEITRRISDFTLRATGLTHWTDMARTAFRMETAAYLARQADRAFDDLDEPLRNLLTARGISAEDWDLLRSPETLFEAPNGAKFLSSTHWRNVTDVPADRAFDLSIRLMAAIEEQIEFAVPTQRIEGRARTQQATQPGTLLGEIARFGMQFKGYGLSFMISQYRRFIGLPTQQDKLGYMAAMGAGLMLTSAIAIQAKSISQGKDPRPMDDPRFWLATTAQSGGLGIFGDFFFSETSRSGGGFARTLAGPVPGMVGDAWNIPANAIDRLAAGDDPLIGRDISQYIRRNTPFFSSAWQVRLSFDRLVADNIQQFLDPEADQALRRAVRRQRREYEAPFWWDPGERKPYRAPDWANILGDD